MTLIAAACGPAGPGEVNQSYAATDADIPNPERGFHRDAEVADSVSSYTSSVFGMTSLYDEGVRMARVYVRLDNFRDAPIDAQLLANLNELFNNARASGIKLIPRFAYNFGTDADAPVWRIEEHLAQLAPVLAEHSDVIVVLQAGFIGSWGEWHTSTNGLTNPDDRARVRTALLNALPQDRMIQLRYPADVIELDPAPVDAGSAFNGSDKARIGHKNDCVLANDHDAGTYWPPSRKAEFQSYLEVGSEFLAVGGETCQVSVGSQRTDCGTAVAEFERFHWDYLNAGFYQDTIELWRNTGCLDEISRRLGYRYRMVQSSIDTTVRAGEPLSIRLEMANDGFGKLFNPRPINVVLTSHATGEQYRVRHTDDARRVLPQPGETRWLNLSVFTPWDLPGGSYDVHLELPDGSPRLAGDARYSIQLANSGTWDGGRGTNDLAVDVNITSG